MATPKPKLDGVDVNDVVTVSKDGKDLLIGGNKMSDIELKNLKEEVKALKNFRVWRIMHETVRHKAIEKGILLSNEWEETLAAKMMLHNLGLLKSVLDVIDRFTPQVIPTPPKKRP